MVISWEAHATMVIQDVLARMPPDATYDQKRKAIQAVYPYGERKNWPYKAWCKAVKRLLPRPRRLERCKLKLFRKPFITFALICDWCDTKNSFCIACLELFRQRETVIHHPEFMALLDAANQGDDVAALAIGDWLKDHEIEFEE